MLHFRHIRLLVCGFIALSLLPACANDHFFPRVRPLFAGLDESRVPASERTALAQAKVDFQLARHGVAPRYARPAGTVPCTHSQVFQGRGYQVTLVNKDLVNTVETGPEIVLDSSITQGRPYHYDEIDHLGLGQTIEASQRLTLSMMTRALQPLPLMTAACVLLLNLPCRADMPVVAAARVERGEVSRDLSFDAELCPFQEVELHAKVTGYLQTLTVDAGDTVKEGQVIATLEVPELQMEIQHALASERRSHAEITRAQASYDEVHLVYTRLIATDKAQPHLIAQADIDAASARDRSAEAAIDAAKEQTNVAEADLKKLQATLEYSKITVPFNGVITKRYTNVGALIQEGTSSGAMPVVRLSQNDKLRLVFPVSMSYVASIKVGDPVEINVTSMNRVLHGVVARFSRKVETSTRTMDTEVDVPNTDLSLIPGIYATATLKSDRRTGVLLAPIEAVLRDKAGSSVYVINKDHKIEARPTKLGQETPSMVEILDGVAENEMILVGSRSQVQPGQVVEPKLIEPAVLPTEPKAPRTAKAS